MQEQEENKKEVPMVDIDTSGPGADIELPEEKEKEKVEVQDETITDDSKSDDTSQKSDEQLDVQDNKDEEKQVEEKPEDKKNELESYSKDVQRRIAKLTKKWREAERQKDEALSYAKLQLTEKEKLEKRYSSVEQAGVKDREAKIKSGLEAAQARLLAARNDSDFKAEVEAQKEIARLGYEEARLEEYKSMAQAKTSTEPKKDINLSRTEQQVSPDPMAEAWAARNKWFGTDTAMTYTAFDLHKKLVDDEGYDPQSDEYYAEIDKRIRLDFPHKFANNDSKVQNSTKPTQIVASAKRSVNNPGRKTVRLTPSQVAIAKKLGVPLEEYAKQLKITEGV